MPDGSRGMRAGGESREPKRYWFPAKRYGWGWGFPATWEGWLVFLGYFVLLGLGGVWFSGDVPARVLPLVVYAVSLSIVLVFVCWRTGEPPRWRWGEDD